MAKGLCTYEGCEIVEYSKGLCNTHWQQMRRKGVLSPIRQYDSTPRERDVCTLCEQELPVEDFVRDKNRTRGYVRTCKTCQAKRTRDRLVNHPEETRKYYREKQRERRYAALGITEEEFQVLLQDQKHGCAICHQDNGERRLVVDHCHDTGRVRGLLCTKCNNGLGYFDDDADRLLAARRYLRR